MVLNVMFRANPAADYKLEMDKNTLPELYFLPEQAYMPVSISPLFTVISPHFNLPDLFNKMEAVSY